MKRRLFLGASFSAGAGAAGLQQQAYLPQSGRSSLLG